MDGTTVDRNIYYYDMKWHVLDSETNTVYVAPNSNELISNFFETLFKRQKAGEDRKNFIIDTDKNDGLFIVVDSINEKCIEYRLVLCRKDALPFIEKGGKLESLGDYIDDDQNIAEITHCVFFKDYGVLGAEFNFSGARASAIAEYITRLDKTESYVTCKSKLNMDAYSKIIKGKSYSLFDFSISSNSKAYTDLLHNKSIFSAIVTQVPDADTIEVVMKKRKTKKNGYTGFECPFTNEEIAYLLKNNKDEIKKFFVSQGTYKDSVDLLADKLVHKATLIKTNKRSIDSQDAYQEIKGFFNTTVISHCN